MQRHRKPSPTRRETLARLDHFIAQLRQTSGVVTAAELRGVIARNQDEQAGRRLVLHARQSAA